MVTISRGFEVKDVNDYKIVTERREREENGKKFVEKFKHIKYKNPKLVTFGSIKRMTQENAPEVLKNVEIFEIPNPYDLDKEEKRYNNITWNLEQSVLALKEGYADGFYTSEGLFGAHTAAFKVVDPIQAVKVREYFLNDFKDWIEQIEKNPFAYVATITTNMATLEIGLSKDPEEDIHNPDNVTRLILQLKKWDSEKTTVAPSDEFDRGTYKQRAERLLEHLYYCRNMTNFWGERLANFLEFDTYEEAAEKAKWLRRPTGGYSGEDFINDGAQLVNHGFQDWLMKRRAA